MNIRNWATVSGVVAAMCLQVGGAQAQSSVAVYGRIDLGVRDRMDRDRLRIKSGAGSHNPVARGTGSDAIEHHRHHADAHDLVAFGIQAGGFDVKRDHRHILQRRITCRRPVGIESP